MDLTEIDVLELLGYIHQHRSWLEIVGYESSTQGLKTFYTDRPNLEPHIISIILTALDEVGQFPRVSRKRGVYIQKVSHEEYVVTESVSKDEWCRRTFATATAAARYLLQRQVRYEHVLSTDIVEASQSVVCTPKWRRRHPQDCS